MNDSVFIFKSEEPSDFKKRAFLGNGYFGIDVSNNFGQGFGITDPREPFPPCYVGGVYVDKGEKPGGQLSQELLTAASMFSVVPNLKEIDNPFGCLEEYSQTHDMKRAITITEGKWNNYRVKSSMFADRVNHHIGCLQVRFKDSSSAKRVDTREIFQLIQTDPRCEYQNFEIENDGELVVISSQIKEAGYEYRNKGFFNIVQASIIRIYAKNERGERIMVESDQHLLNPDDQIEPDDITCFKNKISFQAGGEFTVEMFFALSHDYDSDVSPTLDSLRNMLQTAADSGFTSILKTHQKRWYDDIWSHLIELDDEALQRRVISSMYIMGCTFKEGLHNSTGPTGLNGYGWEGHVFWDADLWVNLGLIPWAPQLSRCITQFRHRTKDGARQHRINYVEQYEYDNVTNGIKFPWQATTSGVETSPPGWESQEHITCDVIFGQYLYCIATGNEQYLKDIAYPLVYDACLYLGQRVEKESDGKYHFHGVVPADEHPFPMQVSDNAFTNLYVATCLKICIEWSKRLNHKYPDHWDDISSNMFYNFDEKEQRVIEFTGYKGQKIKQVDTNLLTFPLEYPFSDDVRRNNMLYYFNKLPENHIMMSSAIFSIVAFELGLLDKAWEYFRDLDPHFQEDAFFNVTESPTNQTWPFITGVGGYLANLYFGFGGIRLRDDGIRLTPQIPLEADFDSITFRSIRFRDYNLKYTIEDRGGSLTLENIGTNGNIPLIFSKRRRYECLDPDAVVQSSENESEIKIVVNLDADASVRFKIA